MEAKAKATAAQTRAEHHSRRLAVAKERHTAKGTKATAAAVERHQHEHRLASAEAARHERRARSLEASHRREQHIRQHDPDVSYAVREARRAGIRPEALHREAAVVRGLDQQHKDGLKTMLQDARQHARSLGTNLNTIRARNARGIDADAVKKLDDVAQSVASAYPEYFPRGADPEEHLFNLLSQGNPQPISRGEAYRKALDRLTVERGRRRKEDEDVPFGER